MTFPVVPPAIIYFILIVYPRGFKRVTKRNVRVAVVAFRSTLWRNERLPILRNVEELRAHVLCSVAIHTNLACSMPWHDRTIAALMSEVLNGALPLFAFTMESASQNAVEWQRHCYERPFLEYCIPLELGYGRFQLRFELISSIATIIEHCVARYIMILVNR